MTVPSPDIARVEGVNLRLRLVEPDDAEFIHGLRTDPRYNTYLSEVTGSAEDQRHWIERYKMREGEGEELYYVIERRDTSAPCGVVRLYDIGRDSFTWGSWILHKSKPPKAALESAVLSLGVGFDALGIPLAHVDVRRANRRATAFYRRFGMTEVGVDDLNFYFNLAAEDFRASRLAVQRVIEEGAITPCP